MGDPVDVTLGEMVDLLGRDTVLSSDGHAGPAMLDFSDGKGCPFEEWASNDPRLDETPQATIQRQVDRVGDLLDWIDWITRRGSVVVEERFVGMAFATREALTAYRSRLLADKAAVMGR